MSIQEKYKNKLFSILGDSISTLDGYSKPDGASYYEGEKRLEADVILPIDTWWGMLINHLGAKLLVNNSMSGSMVCKHRRCEIPSYGCSDERTSSLGMDGKAPDVIMVYLGTNDWGFGMKPTPNRKEYENDLDVFSVAYNTMLEKLKQSYPNAQIWCFTLCASGFKNSRPVEFNFYPGGYHMDEYCKVIRKCASEHDCILIDLYNSVAPFDTVDGYHPNKHGMKTIFKGIIAEL